MYLVRRCALLIEKQISEQSDTYSEWSVSLKEGRLIQRISEIIDSLWRFFLIVFVVFYCIDDIVP